MTFAERFRRLIPGLAAVLVVGSLFFAAQAAVAVTGAAQAASQYKFTQMPIALPPGYNDQHMNTIRQEIGRASCRERV